MGRKGVSKRKSMKTKPKPYAGGTASGSVSSNAQAPESQPAKPMDTGKVSPSTKGSEKPSTNWKKTPKKG
ncbi:hypothetical protein LARV_01347 [Longilinea arvoryzae]|uniref:Uncharacterized protein n=1 Tax=Longilinea arvoryzae TaxID=360412 RepID=A0A0S7BHC2_9CHLR|nr:hypothetical protein [Longilinea arvoryzae]GAP13592.1 hypothetical protein LARV_01347 [Longilinea arvoryzae]